MRHPSRTTERLADPEEPSSQVLMISGKGESAGMDLFTPRVFDEIWPLHLHFLELSVETSGGNVFSGWDLCNKGSMSDSPEMGYGAPCMITSPFHCFSEYMEALPPSSREQDEARNLLNHDAVPYHNRSSYRTMNASAMKAEASILRSTGARGCPSWTSSITFPADNWGSGTITWNVDRTLIEHVPTLMVTFQVDHPSKLLRLGDVAEVSEAVSLHALQWRKSVQEFSERSTTLEVATGGPATFDAKADEAFKCDWRLIALSSAVMVICTVATLWDPVFVLESRSQLGFRGLVLALIGTLSNMHPYFAPWFWAVWGTATHIRGAAWLTRSPLVESHVVESTMIINLAMCLAIMDLFVWVQHFSNLGVRYIVEAEFSDIICKVFEKAGRTTLLSLTFRATLIETIMFLFFYGSVLEVAFRLRSMLFANFLLQIGQLPLLMVCEAQRIKAEVRQVRRKSFRYESEASLEGLVRTSTRRDKFDRLSQIFTQLEVKITVVAASLAFSYYCFVLLEPKGLGYSLSDFVSTNNLERHRTMGMFENQGTFPVSLLFVNVSVETDSQDMLELYREVTDTSRTCPDYLPLDIKNLTWKPPYTSQTHNSIFWQHPEWDREDHFLNNIMTGADLLPTLGVPGICSAEGDPSSSFEYHNRWPALFRAHVYDAVSMPSSDSRASHLYNESLGVDFYRTEASEEYREPGRRSTSDEPHYYDHRAPMDQLVYFYRFYIRDVSEDADIIRAVQRVSAVLNASKIAEGNTFGRVYACGPTFTQYQGLVDMESHMMYAGRIVVVTQFFLSWSFLGARLATVHILSSAMMLMELWGIMMFGVKLNVFSVVGFAFASTLALVFNSNLVVAFKEHPELTPEKRLAVALRVTLPAMLKGSLCLLGAILPLLLSPFPLLVETFAMPSIISVLLGVFHEIIVSPTLLAVVAQNEVTPIKSSDDSDCVGVAVSVPALQGGPNLLESFASGKLDKSAC